jgi:peptidoglycan/LPS O-acetylase OafA/YrhL
MDSSALKASRSQIYGSDRSEGVARFNSRVRGDIEGLRALAVLSVVVYHAFPSALSGGFAGVDIFFVISGYLIGRHLLLDIEAGRFSILEFYSRRARRIFPALLVMLISMLGVGWIAFSAPEFAALGRQIAASALFANNILLWSQSGYFDVAAIDKPLLHLWSLGIEEQFYLLVPVILWVSTARSKGSIRWVARLGVVSLLTTIFVGNLEYAATFYLLHTRFWELAAGAVLAQVELRANTLSQQIHGSSSQRHTREFLVYSIAIIFLAILQFGLAGAQAVRNAFLTYCGSIFVLVVGAAAALLADAYARPDAWSRLRTWALQYRTRLAAAGSIAGMLLMCTSFVAFNSAAWPGALTLIPVLGAACVIAAGPSSLPNRFLGAKPLAFIGGISYPLYLWHWPAIVIWRLLNPNGGALGMGGPLAATLLLAWLTKVLVEDPIRFGKLGWVRLARPPLWPVVSGLAVAGLLGLFVVASGGLSARFPPKLRAIAEWSEVNPDSDWRIGRCYFYTNTSSEFASECTPVKRIGVPLVLLWGDSHAAHLYPGLASIQSSVNLDIVQWTAAGCPPTSKPLSGESRFCPQRRATAMNQLKQNNPDVVLLGGAWERYQELGRSPDQMLGLVAETIRYLKADGIPRIVVFGPGPLWSTSLPADVFRYMIKTGSDRIPERIGRVPDALWQLDAAMAARAADARVEYVSVLRDFCDQSGCLTVGDRSLPRPDLLFRDRDHLTVTGSRVLIEHSTRQLFGGN